MSKLLDDANLIQKECLGRIDSTDELKSLRPRFHMASPCGWINDPNGLSFFNGRLHLFFQYHPYSNRWGPMHWGHAMSEDFLHWNFLPVAMAPDSEADTDGCFSGTAIEDDGKHVIVYTGVIEGNTIQNQSIAIGDGVEYKKFDGNPVITAANIPFEYDKAHFRDPKLWKENGLYYVAAVIKTDDGSGALLIFKSENLRNWEFVSVADRSSCRLGMMWECPDLFSLDGEDVIIISPQEMKEDLEQGWHDGNNSVSMIGKLDRSTWKFNRKIVKQIDFGIDFYAPETTLLPDGRRIMVGWMHRWEGFSTPDDYPWSGMMTLPRELKVKNGKLYQHPIKELDSMRCNPIKGKAVLESEKETTLEGVNGRFFDLELKMKDVGKNSGILDIKIACDDVHCCDLKIDFENLEISFDRSKSGTRKDCESFRRFRFELPVDGMFDLRMVCDISSAEVFVSDGEYAFTNVFYAPKDATEIRFVTSENLSFDYNFYTLV